MVSVARMFGILSFLGYAFYLLDLLLFLFSDCRSAFVAFVSGLVWLTSVRPPV